ncbi:MAG: hypothetical protein IH840_02050, partial [Candidatus Heimdallarchaeota archaeon]|nr:hypothetical protein [Candidatus Heimdallarchaeota archaeon]
VSEATLDDYFELDPSTRQVEAIKTIYIVTDGSLDLTNRKSQSQKCQYCNQLFTKRGIKRHTAKCEVYIEFLAEREKNSGFRVRLYVWTTDCWFCSKQTPVCNMQMEFFSPVVVKPISGNDNWQYFKNLQPEYDSIIEENHIYLHDQKILCSNCDQIQESSMLVEELKGKERAWKDVHSSLEIALDKCKHSQLPPVCISCLYQDFTIE